MTSEQTHQEKLPSLNDMISPEKEVEPNNIIITKESSPEQEVNTQTTTQINEGPTVVKVSKIITTSEPVTETHVTNTKEISSFAILKLENKGSDTYRIEGTTGPNIQPELE